MTEPRSGKTALLFGASGLVGSELTKVLAESPEYEKVIACTRRRMPVCHPKVELCKVDFDDLASHCELFASVDDVFCCLGTTIKKAKSKEAFRKVDYDYPVEIAKLAKEAGVKKFLLITAMGANAKSGIFYNQVKGEVEEAVRALDLPSLHIFRPSLLLGERDEVRLGELFGSVVMQGLSFAMVGSMRKYRPILGSAVASAMYKVAQHGESGAHVYESDQIAEWGKR